MPSSKSSSASKAQRREAARAQAAALRAAQQRRDRRNRLITIIALIVAVAVLAGIVLWVVTSSDKNGSGSDKAAAPTYTPTATALSGVNAPQGVRSDGGIPIGKTGKAGTDNGAGAVEVDVYLDYMCPNCGEFESVNGANLDKDRENGTITEVLHPVAILDSSSSGTMYSTRAASAAAYVTDKAPDALGKFNDLMFSNQPSEGSSGLSDKKIQDIAEQAGVPAKVAAGIGDGTAVTEFGDWVKAATNTAANTDSLKIDYNGEKTFSTPTILVDGTRLEGNWLQASVLQDAIASAQKAK